MFSTLNKLLPSLKSRLLLTITLILTVLISLTLSITYFSVDRALNSRINSQLETRFFSLEKEYSEELNDYEHRSKEKREKEAREELSEKLEDLKDILADRNEWIYLLSPDNKVLMSSKNSPSFTTLSVDLSINKSVAQSEGTEFFYSVFKLPDQNKLLMTADLTDKNDYLALYRNRFLTVSLIVTVLGVFICFAVIRSALHGFEKVRTTADTIAAGDYSQRVSFHSHNSKEVKELTSSFNNMIERTQSLLTEIKEVSNNVAHDLRTPLTRIRGKIETTLMANADLKEHKELSGIVIEECDKLMHLINNMLTLAEYESGLAVKKNEKIDLKTLLENLCGIFESVCEDKKIQIKLKLCQEDLIILGDNEKIQRSLSNLLDNAIKYSKQGDSISIVGKSIADRIEISFIDTGCGISFDDQKRIFERFYRVESSRTTPGNGLGLNLARAFIENHGGQLSVDSQLDKGSCFKVSLASI